MQRPSVVVVGSANVDRFFRAPRLPGPGETVTASAFASSYGGKGANQAVAAAKLGARAVMVCRVGNDTAGDELVENFKLAGVRTDYVVRDPRCSSGSGFVTVDESGENTIVVYPGANGMLCEADVEMAAGEIAGSDIAICQLEVPIPAVVRTARICREAGTRFIFNPAPAPNDDISEVLRLTDVLCLNQTEARSLTGEPAGGSFDAARISRTLVRHGAAVVLTLGAGGAFLSTSDGETHIPSPNVNVRDTTGAGDAFVGALAFFLASGRDVQESVMLANIAAALSVTREGTQAGLPTRAHVEEFRRSIVRSGEGFW